MSGSIQMHISRSYLVQYVHCPDCWYPLFIATPHSFKSPTNGPPPTSFTMNSQQPSQTNKKAKMTAEELTPAPRQDNSQDYYKKGSQDLATESALTLAKIEHVSSFYFNCLINVFMLCLVIKLEITRQILFVLPCWIGPQSIWLIDMLVTSSTMFACAIPAAIRCYVGSS